MYFIILKIFVRDHLPLKQGLRLTLVDFLAVLVVQASETIFH